MSKLVGVSAEKNVPYKCLYNYIQRVTYWLGSYDFHVSGPSE